MAGLAQLVEQLICNQQVGGSNPSASSRNDYVGRFPSGQRGQTVNLLAQPSKVRILLSPPPATGPGSSVVERFLGKEKVGSSILLSGSSDIEPSPCTGQ